MKTEPGTQAVADHLAGVSDPKRRADAQQVCDLLAEGTGEPPVMWGSAIIGFGSCTRHYHDGREYTWMLAGFAARKAATVLYLNDGYEQHGELLERLGPHSIGKSCLNLRTLQGVDLGVLRELVAASVATARAGES